MHVRLKRLAEAEAYPDRFRLLCPKCHLVVELIKKLRSNPGIDKSIFEQLIK